MAIGKVYFNIHADIDDDGRLVLKDDHGRILKGVRNLDIYTGVEDVSTANVDVFLSKFGDGVQVGMVNGKVK